MTGFGEFCTWASKHLLESLDCEFRIHINALAKSVFLDSVIPEWFSGPAFRSGI
ncbi:hypothetical protein VSU01S_19750 [Vibrio superstes NBRC 103154]|uniref:Uncharacterized protein n=1 Tax=Vibrio superstes NBRC 103154 TaxID=1219062 RepID=A0A511QQW4_9VIBR|nr:hypothetical protein VSU01S_19750 [Vibrio superstes NBRC 103154]